MEFKEMVIARNCLMRRKEDLINQALAAIAAESEILDAEIKDLDDQINERINNRSIQIRQHNQKDYGIIRMIIDGVKIKHDQPKKITWNQEQLAAIRDKIKADGDDPSEYIKEKLEVSERSFQAWPDIIKKWFIPARTEKPGQSKIVSIEL